MYEEITLQDLDRDKVNVMRRKYIELEGTSYPIGDIFRRSYANSANGRKQVQEEIAEPYFRAWAGRGNQRRNSQRAEQRKG